MILLRANSKATTSLANLSLWHGKVCIFVCVGQRHCCISGSLLGRSCLLQWLCRVMGGRGVRYFAGWPGGAPCSLARQCVGPPLAGSSPEDTLSTVTGLSQSYPLPQSGTQLDGGQGLVKGGLGEYRKGREGGYELTRGEWRRLGLWRGRCPLLVSASLSVSCPSQHHRKQCIGSMVTLQC